MHESEEFREGYLLERVVNGIATPIATFYSAKEAKAILPSLDATYRLKRGDLQIWPETGSSARHETEAN